VTAWFLASSAPSASRTDHHLLKDIYLFKEQNNHVSEVAMKKINGHIRYLFEELIALSLFDYGVPNDTKHPMKTALQALVAEHPHKMTVDSTVVNSKL
jgi:hypothetical protein